MTDVSEDGVRKKAQELWEAAGRPEGRDEAFWLEAERQLKETVVAHELKTPDTL